MMAKKTTQRRASRPRKSAAEIVQAEPTGPEISVLLPTWNNLSILWLQLEALLRQQTQRNYEIVIHECPVSGGYPSCGLIEDYAVKFENLGVQVTYLQADKRTHLVDKWRILAQAAKSDNVLMVASDNYTPSAAIEAYCDAFNQGHDWIDCPNGYFYDIASRKVAQYKAPEGRTGLLFATKKSYIDSLPSKNLDKNIDGYIRSTINPVSIANLEFIDGVLTDGYQSISHHRSAKYSGLHKKPPFYDTDTQLEDLVPSDVAMRLRKMKPFVVT